MVQPQYNVAVIVVLGSCDRDRLIRVVGENSEGAGSVKCKASNGVGNDIMLIQYTLDRVADAAPDIICGLFLFWISFQTQPSRSHQDASDKLYRLLWSSNGSMRSCSTIEAPLTFREIVECQL